MKRRGFLAGGAALVVGFAWRSALPQATPAAPAPDTSGLPGSLKTQPLLDGWIRVDTDGRITVFTGKAELGQGIKTALLQIAAEELVVAPGRITLVTADTERTANEAYTAGSRSMQDSGTAIRHAAAQVRGLLLLAAAERLALPLDQLTLEDGVIRGGGQSLSYGDLAASAQLHANAAPQSVLRDRASYSVIGKPLARTDIPAKLTGGAAYVQDLRIEGMVHGRIVRPPDARALLKKRFESFDETLLAAAFAEIRKGTPRPPVVTKADLENAELYNIGAGLLRPEEKMKSYDGLYTDEYVR